METVESGRVGEYVARLEFRLCSILVPEGRLSDGVVTRIGLQRGNAGIGVKERKNKV
jgi:hypothetical protein